MVVTKIMLTKKNPEKANNSFNYRFAVHSRLTSNELLSNDRQAVSFDNSELVLRVQASGGGWVESMQRGGRCQMLEGQGSGKVGRIGQEGGSNRRLEEGVADRRSVGN